MLCHVTRCFRMCVLGKRLLKDIHIEDCNKKPGGPLEQLFCGNSSRSCDQYYSTHNVTIVRGIKGLASGVLLGTIAYYIHTYV